jgi:hypothetical protein
MVDKDYKEKRAITIATCSCHSTARNLLRSDGVLDGGFEVYHFCNEYGVQTVFWEINRSEADFWCFLWYISAKRYASIVTSPKDVADVRKSGITMSEFPLQT